MQITLYVNDDILEKYSFQLGFELIGKSIFLKFSEIDHALEGYSLYIGSISKTLYTEKCRLKKKHRMNSDLFWILYLKLNHYFYLKSCFRIMVYSLHSTANKLMCITVLDVRSI